MAALTLEQRDFLLPKAYNAALRAGAMILDVYNGGDYGIEQKSDHTPITTADRLSHDLIKSYLGSTHIPLLSEEGREMVYEERRSWDLFWMVDPLDGTKEFIKGNGEFTVNIALMVDNVPAVGIIYVPYIGRIYVADRISGRSIRKEGVAPDPAAEFTLEQILDGGVALPAVEGPNRPIRIAASRSHNTDQTKAHIAEIKRKHPNAAVIEQGSSYKFCLLAEGSVDYYPRMTHTYEWDTAAGELILELAGGATRALDDDSPLGYNKESLLNPHFACRSKFMALA
ncbi:MAG: 3'(2'),5'-bisphosphate nucleotidase CysQ [Rikenellaceae bacterium]|jgi:3'(2'), 5'-bisphosphate nucleotidase|nr:3'(2'),5'-bisphosphate nucleotidase CysQ [Rikenellaceae bacterium]